MNSRTHIERQADDHDKEDSTLLDRLAESFESVRLVVNEAKKGNTK